MGSSKSNRHPQNLLNTSYLALITISLGIALLIAHSFTGRYVTGEFNTQKISVLEETLQPYNDFFLKTVPEVSYYQGYLDSASAIHYANSVFQQYSFVTRIIFFDTEISNHSAKEAYRVNSFSMWPKSVYQFAREISSDSVVFKGSGVQKFRVMSEFNRMADRFSDYIFNLDTTRYDDQTTFGYYNIGRNRITYMNVPRQEDLRKFKKLMFDSGQQSPSYSQDVLSFALTPFRLKVRNRYPRLYQTINIKPITFESLDNKSGVITTELPMSGAFADYKLVFRSSQNHLNDEVNRKYLPVALSIFGFYTVLGIIIYLIYRNNRTNSRLFKLQYDFVNNLTHEIKTPLSVIKIAGSNLLSSKTVSEQERLRYGRILDEEADKLNDLMNKLLSFTQIENQSIPLKDEAVQIEPFLQSLIEAYQLKSPDFTISYRIETVEAFRTDPILMTSVFQNLIDNAYKYSNSNRRELLIDISKDGGNIVIKFIDKGIGIPREELSNIFRKFYRIQSEYNQQGSVGLGLAFCKELIHFMKGEISVKSELGIGSEFIITLPHRQ